MFVTLAPTAQKEKLIQQKRLKFNELAKNDSDPSGLQHVFRVSLQFLSQIDSAQEALAAVNQDHVLLWIPEVLDVHA